MLCPLWQFQHFGSVLHLHWSCVTWISSAIFMLSLQSLLITAVTAYTGRLLRQLGRVQREVWADIKQRVLPLSPFFLSQWLSPFITFAALLSERRRYCGARRMCVCVCPCVCPPSRDCRRVALVSAAKVMRCIQCSLVLEFLPLKPKALLQGYVPVSALF